MSSTQTYSFVERMLHRVAFASPAVQIGAADMEKAVYGSRLRHIPVERPIFITSLPRAGTTLILELLTGLPGLATHLYRDMPFVMAPLLWEGLSRRFRKPAQLIERAHGDGMKVSYDSPEAFEEVLWRAFWPKKFKRDRIALWAEQEDAGEFLEFFVSHMQRIIAVRSDGPAERRRYVSKNNANVARLRFLKRLFRDSLIVIPFRNPVAQAASLLQQHGRFLTRHRDDAFARRYMDDIGHLEFGALHRPIDFEGIDEMRTRYHADSMDYWTAYWFHGFRHIVGYQDRVIFVSYERLCEQGSPAVRVLADRLGIRHEDSHNTAMSEFWKPRSYSEAHVAIENKDLLEATQRLHGQLLKLSIV